MGNVRKTISYLKRNGLSKTLYMVKQRLNENRMEEGYEARRRADAATPQELLAQSVETFEKNVRISLLIPAYETPEEFLRILLDSILVQSYENFQVCLADASSSDAVKNVVLEYDDERICYRKLEKNKGISENTNAALEMADGDVVCAVDHDDILEPDSLYHIAKAFAKGAAAVYTDEDKVCTYAGANETVKYSKPNRKPDFNYDYLLSNNYICHLFAVKTQIARAVGGFRREFDGAQDYDFILRCVGYCRRECADGDDLREKIAHVNRILYHWRIHESSTADNPESKLYAYESGKFALIDFLEANNIKAEVRHTEHLGFYRISYAECDNISDVTVHVPGDCIPADKDALSKLKSYFARSEVKSVCARLVDKRGKVLDVVYQGMDMRDSGVMHKAHMVQDIDELTDVYVTRNDSSGSLIVYDPQIIWRKQS